MFKSAIKRLPAAVGGDYAEKLRAAALWAASASPPPPPRRRSAAFYRFKPFYSRKTCNQLKGANPPPADVRAAACVAEDAGVPRVRAAGGRRAPRLDELLGSRGREVRGFGLW